MAVYTAYTVGQAVAVYTAYTVAAVAAVVLPEIAHMSVVVQAV